MGKSREIAESPVTTCFRCFLYGNMFLRSVSMSRYPVKAALFLLVLSAAALYASVRIVTAGDVTEMDFLAIFVWSLIGVLNESFSVYISRGNIYISTIEAVFFVSYLAGGPAVALICIVATIVFSIRRIEGRARHLFNIPFRLSLFNISHYIVALFVLDRLYMMLHHLTGELVLIPALATAPILFLFSCGMNALFYKLEEGRKFLHYFTRVFKPFYLETISASVAAVIVALAYPRYGLLSVFFFFTPILVARLAMLDKARSL